MKRELLRIVLAVGFAWLGLLLISNDAPDNSGPGDQAMSRRSGR
jgi:hypothetical protein